MQCFVSSYTPGTLIFLDCSPGKQRHFAADADSEQQFVKVPARHKAVFAAPERPQQELTAATSGSVALAARLPGHSTTTQPRHKLPCVAEQGRNCSGHT